MKLSDIRAIAKAVGRVLRIQFDLRDAQIKTLQAQVAELQAKLTLLIEQRSGQ